MEGCIYAYVYSMRCLTPILCSMLCYRLGDTINSTGYLDFNSTAGSSNSNGNTLHPTHATTPTVAGADGTEGGGDINIYSQTLPLKLRGMAPGDCLQDGNRRAIAALPDTSHLKGKTN